MSGTAKMQNYYSDEWCNDEKARTQDELQEIAGKIRHNCDVSEIHTMDGYTCTIYINKNLGLRFWIKDTFGHISEINEERRY